VENGKGCVTITLALLRREDVSQREEKEAPKEIMSVMLFGTWFPEAGSQY